MKSILIVAMAALSVLSAGAQFRKSVDVELSQPQPALTRVDLPVHEQEMKMRAPGEPVLSPLRSYGTTHRVHYNRPGGAFFANFIAVNGALFSYVDKSFLLMKPYADYTFHGIVEGFEANDTVIWQYETADKESHLVGNLDLTLKYGLESLPTPRLYLCQNVEPYDGCWYQYPFFSGSSDDDDDDDNPVIINTTEECRILSVPTTADFDDSGEVEFLLTSKTMVEGEKSFLFTNFYGATPHGDNKRGWWFGKNGEHIDGMAQAFEKPQHPYLLKKVYLMMDPNNLVCNGDVKLTCRVYKLEGIPDYDESGCATLPVEPGELIVTGEGIVTPSTADDNGGLVEFTLYDCDEDDPSLTFEYTPTIDYPILVCIDGYNDLEAADLVDFTAFISENWHFDEGYGELAYLKYPCYDMEIQDSGDTVYNFNGEYYWRGLNNFFSGPMEMKTGLTIYIAADRPYLAFNREEETGEYIFPTEGGIFPMWYEGNESAGIEFKASTPSADDDWEMTCRGEDVPHWLDIELVDGEDEDGEFNNIVTAQVTAEPLPEGVSYREAIVRFGFPGAYLDCKFMQGEKVGPIILPCDDDGEINIADVNCMIDLLLNGMYDNCYDINADGELSIADVNLLINYILSGL